MQKKEFKMHPDSETDPIRREREQTSSNIYKVALKHFEPSVGLLESSKKFCSRSRSWAWAWEGGAGSGRTGTRKLQQKQWEWMTDNENSPK